MRFDTWHARHSMTAGMLWSGCGATSATRGRPSAGASVATCRPRSTRNWQTPTRRSRSSRGSASPPCGHRTKTPSTPSCRSGRSTRTRRSHRSSCPPAAGSSAAFPRHRSTADTAARTAGCGGRPLPALVVEPGLHQRRRRRRRASLAASRAAATARRRTRCRPPVNCDRDDGASTLMTAALSAFCLVCLLPFAFCLLPLLRLRRINRRRHAVVHRRQRLQIGEQVLDVGIGQRRRSWSTASAAGSAGPCPGAGRSSSS